MARHNLKILKCYLTSIRRFLITLLNRDVSKLISQSKVSRWELAKLQSNFATPLYSKLQGKQIEIGDTFWHLHSLKEIFVEQTYKFNSKSEVPTILDCGANIGLSIIYFKQLYPKANIIAFEPDDKICKKLVNNLKVFNYDDVQVYNSAIWTEKTLLNFDQDNALGGTLNHGKVSSKTIRVSALALSDFITHKIDFLKIDIEGAEFDVIKSVQDKLHFVENLFVEYHSSPNQMQKISELLTIIYNAGFRVYIKEAWNNLPIPFEYANYTPFWDLQLNIFAYKN